jgi:hypothetical protein
VALASLHLLDIGGYLGATWNQIRQLGDADFLPAKTRLLSHWQQAFGTDLGEMVAELRTLTNSQAERTARLEFTQANLHRQKALLHLADAISRNDERLIRRWRWVAAAYRRSVETFLTERRGASQVRNSVSPLQDVVLKRELRRQPVTAAASEVYKTVATGNSFSPDHRLHGIRRIQEIAVEMRTSSAEHIDLLELRDRLRQELDELRPRLPQLQAYPLPATLHDQIAGHTRTIQRHDLYMRTTRSTRACATVADALRAQIGSEAQSSSDIIARLAGRLIVDQVVDLPRQVQKPKLEPAADLKLFRAQLLSSLHALLKRQSMPKVFFCLICENRRVVQPVVFRGKEMCQDCAALLQRQL